MFVKRKCKTGIFLIIYLQESRPSGGEGGYKKKGRTATLCAVLNIINALLVSRTKPLCFMGCSGLQGLVAVQGQLGRGRLHHQRWR